MPASSTAVAKLQKHWTNIAHHLYLKHECPVPLPAGSESLWQLLLVTLGSLLRAAEHDQAITAKFCDALLASGMLDSLPGALQWLLQEHPNRCMSASAGAWLFLQELIAISTMSTGEAMAITASSLSEKQVLALANAQLLELGQAGVGTYTLSAFPNPDVPVPSDHLILLPSKALALATSQQLGTDSTSTALQLVLAACKALQAASSSKSDLGNLSNAGSSLGNLNNIGSNVADGGRAVNQGQQDPVSSSLQAGDGTGGDSTSIEEGEELSEEDVEKDERCVRCAQVLVNLCPGRLMGMVNGLGGQEEDE
eukprot:gene2014-2336_t